MKNNKLVLSAVLLIASFSLVYSYYGSFGYQVSPEQDAKLKEKMADIQYKKDELSADIKEQKAKADTRYQQKRADVQHKKETIQAKIAREKQVADAERNRNRALFN